MLCIHVCYHLPPTLLALCPLTYIPVFIEPIPAPLLALNHCFIHPSPGGVQQGVNEIKEMLQEQVRVCVCNLLHILHTYICDYVCAHIICMCTRRCCRSRCVCVWGGGGCLYTGSHPSGPWCLTAAAAGALKLFSSSPRSLPIITQTVTHTAHTASLRAKETHTHTIHCTHTHTCTPPHAHTSTPLSTHIHMHTHTLCMQVLSAKDQLQRGVPLSRDQVCV